jgi:hypothetical protein
MTAGNHIVVSLRSLWRPWVLVGAFGFAVACVVGVGNGQTSQPGGADEVSGFANGSFEELNAAGLPKGWSFPPPNKTLGGYKASPDTTSPFAGKNCGLIASTSERQTNPFGSLNQMIDVRPYRGQRLRFRAAVRTAELEGDARAQLWFRVNRTLADGRSVIGAFDNMRNRPIREDGWRHFEIIGQVDDDAATLVVGLLLVGKGKAWIDDATLEVVSETTEVTAKKMPETQQKTAANPSAGKQPSAAQRPSAAQGNSSEAQRSIAQAVQKAALQKPQPFFVAWLWLPVIALVLFGLSQTKLGLVQRFAFRFSFAYWLLYSLPKPLLSLIPSYYAFRLNRFYDSQVDKVVSWTAAHGLGITQMYDGPSGSGDKTSDFVRLLVCFVLASAIAVVWSAVDWRKTDHPWLKDLLRSYLRYVLAFTMLGYGLAKVGSEVNQFAEPPIERLMSTYGDSSPMGLVWTFMGASRAYTRFAGLGEIVGGLLLIWRRTTIVGAAVTFGVMMNVMMLNFCYDVPVKQYSFHLVVMALYLLLADAPRLANLLIWNRPVDKASLLPPYTGLKTIWVQRALKAYIIVMGVAWPLGSMIYRETKQVDNKLAQPAFFGTYEVDEFVVDGEPVPPMLSDNTRWRYLSISRSRFGQWGARIPTDYFSVRMMNRSQRGSPLVVSHDGKALMLESAAMAGLPSKFTVDLLDDRQLALSGVANGKKMEIKLHKLNREDFVLVNRGFHWVNEIPFNR